MPHDFFLMRPKGAMECGSLLPPWLVCLIFRACSKAQASLRTPKASPSALPVKAFKNCRENRAKTIIDIGVNRGVLS
jgi:hypothetical protein